MQNYPNRRRRYVIQRCLIGRDLLPLQDSDPAVLQWHWEGILRLDPWGIGQLKQGHLCRAFGVRLLRLMYSGFAMLLET